MTGVQTCALPIFTVAAVWTWAIIVWSHLNFRRAIREGTAQPVAYRLPWAPFSNWFVLLFLFVVTVTLGFDAETRIALYVAPVWFAILAICYRISVKRTQPLSD